MSLAIDVDRVVEVLLADGWHNVDQDQRRGRSTFYLDAYEFVDGPDDAHRGGADGICATGFAFVEAGFTVSGPLTAVLAVRTLARTAT